MGNQIALLMPLHSSKSGNLEIDGKNTKLTHVSNIFTSDDSLTGEEITLEPDNDAQNVVSFKLDPKGDNAGELLAYC